MKRAALRRPRTLVRAFAAVTVMLGVLLPAAPGASAMIDPSKGKPGFCQDGTGVTVVVDFQQLGGTTIVRCNPQPERGTGLDALKGAGFQIAGVQRWGEAFICRIENRPSAVEKIPVTGNENYMEACIDTPPAAGYWSYWHAGNNCAWKYSQWGVKNRDFVAGGFEGWSFSLNATAETNPKPRIAAVRPGTEGGSCDTPDEPAPTTNDPSAVQPGSGGDDPPQDPPRTDPDPPAAQDPAPRADQNPPAAQDPPRVDATPSTSPSATPLRPDPDSPAARDPAAPDAPAVQDAPSTDPTRWEEPGEAAPPQEASRQDGSTLPRPLPRRPEASVADDPAHNVAFVGGQDAPDITEVVKEQSGASDYAPWAAAAATVALGAATWLTARRRRRSRDA